MSVTRPLSGGALFAAAIGIAVANFMNVLDTTIAIVSVPAIAGGLGATPSQGTWVIAVYAVCLAVVLPLSGWLARQFGDTRVFLVSIVLFTIMSALCGAASNFTSLLIFRALQGAAGGLLLPLSQSLLLKIYPQERQGEALALWSLTSAVAPIVGPVLGGYLTDNMGWQWIFYVNIPIGIVCWYLCWLELRKMPSDIDKRRIDLPGLLFLITGVLCAQLALDRGSELDWFSSGEIRQLFMIAIPALLFFYLWERDEEHPVVDLQLFRYRSFLVGSFSIALMYVVFIISMVVYPIWLQTTMGYTALWAGLVMAPTMAAPLILMPLIGKHLERMNPKLLIAVGAIFFAIGVYMHSQNFTEMNYAYISKGRFMIGVSMAFMWMPLLSLCFSEIPIEKMASATGLNNFIRMLGGSVGTAAGVTLWDHRVVYHHSTLVEGINQINVVDGLAADATSLNPQALQMLEYQVQRQAATLGLNDVFIIALGIIFIVLVMGLVTPFKEKH